MNDKTRKEVALFRYGIIAPIISETYDEDKGLKDFSVMPQAKYTLIQRVKIPKFLLQQLNDGTTIIKRMDLMLLCL